MNRVRELRHKMGLTQVQLAERLNLSQSALSNYETGRINIDNDTLRKISRFFDVSIDELLGIEADEIPKRPEISDAEYSLTNEIRNLSEQEMREVLDFVRFKRTQRKC